MNTVVNALIIKTGKNDIFINYKNNLIFIIGKIKKNLSA